jgi:hypothetical protein
LRIQKIDDHGSCAIISMPSDHGMGWNFSLMSKLVIRAPADDFSNLAENMTASSIGTSWPPRRFPSH